MTDPKPTERDIEQAKEIIRAWCWDDKCLELTTEHDQENKGALAMQGRIARALAARDAEWCARLLAQEKVVEAARLAVKQRQWFRILQETDATENDVEKARLDIEFAIDDLRSALSALDAELGKGEVC